MKAHLQRIFDDLPKTPRESVWSYPEIPRIEPCVRLLKVVHSGRTIAETTHGLRVVELGHPPVYFFPLDDASTRSLAMTRGRRWYAHRGEARFFDVNVDGRRSPRAAWTHPRPEATHSALRGHVAFHAGRVDGCSWTVSAPSLSREASSADGSPPTWSVPTSAPRADTEPRQGKLTRTTQAPRGSTPGR